MTRLVRTEAGVVVDPTGKLAGRGAYLHAYRECWELALRGNRIEQALRTRLSQEDRRRLADYMETLPVAQEDGVEDVQTDVPPASLSPAG